FFFSSRRRHTRCSRDWSSDVCSSDLGEQIGSIGHGLVLLLGIAKGDIRQDLDYVVDRVVNLRIFSDAAGRMNRSLLDVQGALLVDRKSVARERVEMSRLA